MLQLGIVVVGVAIAASVRWFIDRGANGVPFVTFVPLVVLAAVFLQWQYAVLVAFVSLATVVTLFGETARMQPTVQNIIVWCAFGFIAAFMIVTGHILRQTILDLDAQSERVRAFNAELQHRTKNTLQIVRALASRAARSTDPVDFYNTLSGRLDALAKANELLGYGSLHASAMEDIVAAAMQPFPAWAVHASGPHCVIAGEPGMQLMMALHELGTNAMKYGALSVESGRVTVTWSQREDGVELIWTERGGPPVSPPTKFGLGSRMLSPSGALRDVALDYRPEGVVCRIGLTLSPEE